LWHRVGYAKTGAFSSATVYVKLKIISITLENQNSIGSSSEVGTIDPALIHATEAVLKERDKPVISKSRIQVCAPA
jgi:hypothetical protein